MLKWAIKYLVNENSIPISRVNTATLQLEFLMKNIHSNVNAVNLMVSFDAETIFRHFDEIVSDGGIIYDSELEDVTTDRVNTLDSPFKDRLHKFLESKNKPFTIAGVLEVAKENGVKLYPVSFKSLLQTLSEEVDNPRLRGLVRMYNVLGVSLSLGLIKMPSTSLVDSIDDIFSKKPKIAEINKQAAIFLTIMHQIILKILIIL